MTTRVRSNVIALALIALAAGPSPARAAAPAPEDSSAVADLQREAEALAPLAGTELGRSFLAATGRLPHVTPRTVHHDSSRTRYWSAAEAAALQ